MWKKCFVKRREYASGHSGVESSGVSSWARVISALIGPGTYRSIGGNTVSVWSRIYRNFLFHRVTHCIRTVYERKKKEKKERLDLYRFFRRLTRKDFHRCRSRLHRYAYLISLEYIDILCQINVPKQVFIESTSYYKYYRETIFFRLLLHCCYYVVLLSKYSFFICVPFYIREFYIRLSSWKVRGQFLFVTGSYIFRFIPMRNNYRNMFFAGYGYSNQHQNSPPSPTRSSVWGSIYSPFRK